MDNPSAFISVKSVENRSENVYDDPGSVVTLPNQYLEPIVPKTVHNQPIANTLSSSTRLSHPFSDVNQNDDASSSSSSSKMEQGNSKESEPKNPNNIWSTWKPERQLWLSYHDDWMIPYGYQEFRISQPVFLGLHDKLNCKKRKNREFRTMSFKLTIILCGAVTILTVIITIFVAVYYGMIIPTTIT